MTHSELLNLIPGYLYFLLMSFFTGYVKLSIFGLSNLLLEHRRSILPSEHHPVCIWCNPWCNAFDGMNYHDSYSAYSMDGLWISSWKNSLEDPEE